MGSSQNIPVELGA